MILIQGEIFGAIDLERTDGGIAVLTIDQIESLGGIESIVFSTDFVGHFNEKLYREFYRLDRSSLIQEAEQNG